MTKTNDRLLADLIAEVEIDLSEGREDLGPKAAKIRGLILARMVEPKHEEPRHKCDTVGVADLEFQGTIGAPGYGNSWKCRVCEAPWTQAGGEFFRPDEEEGEPRNMLGLGDVV